MRELVERARASLELIGEGEWTPQDMLLSQVIVALEEAEHHGDYLQREINLMRRVMQDAETWDEFVRAYATYTSARGEGR